MMNPVHEYIRYTRVKNVPFIARSEATTSDRLRMLAALAGCADEDARELAERCDLVAADHASALLQRAGIRELVDRLQLRRDERIVVVGDSISADRSGWVEQFRHLLRRHSRWQDVTVQNLGLSGSTSVDAVERLDQVLAARGTLIIIEVGTNDARRQGALPDSLLLDIAETRRSFGLLRRALSSENTRLIAMTPPPTARIPAMTAVHRGGTSSFPEDLMTIADTARVTFSELIDLREPNVYDPDDLDLVRPDGIHPTPAGGSEILRAVLTHLSRR